MSYPVKLGEFFQLLLNGKRIGWNSCIIVIQTVKYLRHKKPLMHNLTF